MQKRYIKHRSKINFNYNLTILCFNSTHQDRNLGTLFKLLDVDRDHAIFASRLSTFAESAFTAPMRGATSEA